MKTLTILGFYSLAFAQEPPAPQPLPNVAVPLMQIGGDLSQLWNPTYSPNSSYGFQTATLARTNAGVVGLDEGAWALFPDGRMVSVTGDAQSSYFRGGKNLYFSSRQSCGSDGALSGGRFNCLSLKGIMTIPAGPGGKPFDPYSGSSNGIPAIDAALTAGRIPGSATYTGLPSISFVLNSSHTSTEPAFALPTMSGLGTDPAGKVESITAGREVNGLFVNPATNAIYALWNVTRQARGGHGLQYQVEEILAKASLPTTSFPSNRANSEISWTKKYIWSDAPQILTLTATVTGGTAVARTAGSSFSSYMTGLILECAGSETHMTYVDANSVTVTPAISNGGDQNCTIMQAQENNTGKFVLNAPMVLQPSSLSWHNQLPNALQSESYILCGLGSSWAWRQSKLYFGCLAMSKIDSTSYSGGNGVNGATGGIADMWYVTTIDDNNKPTWVQGHEEQAVPVLTSTTCIAMIITGACIGEHSARFSPALGLFVLTYGSAEAVGIRMRTAPRPWGPWSAETQIVPNSGMSLAARLIYFPASPPPQDFNLVPPNNALVSCARCNGRVATNILYDPNHGNSQITRGSNPGSPFNLRGNPYGPYQLPTEHDFGSGVMLFMDFSTFDPYQVFLAQVTVPGAIAITAPAANQTAGGTRFTFTGTLAGLNSTASLQYVVDRESIGMGCIAHAPPWSCEGGTNNGHTDHSVVAIARDARDQTIAKSSEVTFGDSHSLTVCASGVPRRREDGLSVTPLVF